LLACQSQFPNDIWSVLPPFKDTKNAAINERSKQWNLGIGNNKTGGHILPSYPRKKHRKHLTAIATSFHPVSLNIVLQKALGLQ
jgi:hypothetical protein